jgi:Na+-translocating ferredoxin:NAD+ oxidoreductase RnfD subunit
MLAFLGLWLAIVVITAVVMAHRGHSWFSWAVVAAAFGPLAWPLAVRELLADRRSVAETPVEGDVLVAVAAWADSTAPILEALRELDPPPRAVTLATVLDAEDERTIAGRAAADEREEFLRRCASEVEASGAVGGPVRWELRYGRVPDELAELARAGAHRCIVLGPSGSAVHPD